jgi:hypothetical protein
MNLKENILARCKKILDEKITSLLSSIGEVSEASNSESKSSVGDKHETTKAMMQIELEKLGKQLAELKLQRIGLEKLRLDTSSDKITTGSLVETDKAIFFLATAIGKVKIDDKEIFVISAQSPVGQKLISLKGNSFEMNGQIYSIKSVI